MCYHLHQIVTGNEKVKRGGSQKEQKDIGIIYHVILLLNEECLKHSHYHQTDTNISMCVRDPRHHNHKG